MSAISLVGQRWKEFWGTSVTKNQQLDTKKDLINKIDQYIRLAGRTIQGIAYQHESEVFKNLDDIENVKVSQEMINTFESLSQYHFTKIQKILEATKNFDEWFDIINTLKQQLEKYQASRLVYDHYRYKIDDLKKLSENRTSKIIEKLKRNEEKFSKSQNDYNKISNDILEKMDKIINQKREMLTKAIQIVIYNETETAYKTYKQLIKHEDFKSHFGGNNIDSEENNQEKIVKEQQNQLDNFSIQDIQPQNLDQNPFEQNQKSPYIDEGQQQHSQLVSSFFSQGIVPQGVNPFQPNEYQSFPSIYLAEYQQNNIQLTSILKQSFKSQIDPEQFKQSKQPLE